LLKISRLIREIFFVPEADCAYPILGRASEDIQRMSRHESSNGDGRNIVVIGASAGGVQVLQELMRGFPEDFPGAVFVVVHTSASSPGILPQILGRAGPLPAAHAEQGGKIRMGRVYVAPPDSHLLVKDGHTLVTRGPKENGFRPAVDVLFRTAAQAYGPRVVGIVLTGGLDDGTVGLIHIKNQGGIAVAQDPGEAVFPSMPQSAMDNVNVDYVVPVAEMPALLSRLASEPLPQGVNMPRRRNGRPDVAEAGSAILQEEREAGPPTAFTCPECGGSLWERKNGKMLRYECHVGHTYTAESLLSEKSDELESVLWGALRALEENAELRSRMARRAAKGPPALQYMGERYEREAKEAQQRAAVLREVLTNGRTLKKIAQTAGGAEKKARRARSQSLGRQKGDGSSKRRSKVRD
jgi:two-component system chemotaxis response regulator CheB